MDILERIVCTIAATMMTAGCGRMPSQAPALPAAGTQPTANDWSDPKQLDVLRAKGREALGVRLCASLDRIYGYWVLASQEEAPGARFLTVKTSHDAMQNWAFVGVSDGGEVFMNIPVAARVSATLCGLHDIDGDGSKEAAIWIGSGENAGNDDCYFVKLPPRPRVLGGCSPCPDCGRAVDLDHDGLLEFDIPDLSLDHPIGPSRRPLTLPMIYGCRHGRFVDLTARIAREKLEFQLESARARSRLLARLREDQQEGWRTEAVMWYAYALMLGHDERAVVREMKAVLPTDHWKRIAAEDLPEVRECIKRRQDRFFVGTGAQ